MKEDPINNSPKFLIRFFRWFCHPDYVEDIEGDLQEQYERFASSHSKRRAHWLFLLAVLSLLRPGLIRPITFRNHLIHPIMFRHNFKISWRLLFKNKGYSLINIGGLAMGMAVAMFIVLWMTDEIKFDRFHESGDRIYRVMRHVYSGNDIKSSSLVGWNIAGALREEYPEVEKVAITSRPSITVFQQEEA
ncbi:MAG: permease prefix domain 2-containing transporter, partial [Bacteroidota bacterium]